ncbi:BTAD domain-containing putative transcriptional regulator [Streptomyces sp. NPDC006997]|uniref:AfsR/SARP family transcriptional regulator n=1 Tax=Streptomyces sp. NPDC006997 TaxID=3155356 RepID=UPI0033DFC9CD
MTADGERGERSLDIYVLGHLDVFSAGRAVPLGGTRERTVLALLLLEAGHVVPMGRLIDAVWDDEPPVTARGQIQFCVSALRRRLHEIGAEDLIETRRPGYLLRVTGHRFDAHDFAARAREARAARVEGDLVRAMDLFRSALSLWRGPALADVDSPLVRQAVSHLDERRLSVTGEGLDCALEAGEHHEVIGQLRGLVADHPLHERFWALLMSALHASGRKAEALDAYRTAYKVFREELGIAPGSELRGLHAALLSGDDPVGPSGHPAPGADAPRTDASRTDAPHEVAAAPTALPPAAPSADKVAGDPAGTPSPGQYAAPLPWTVPPSGPASRTPNLLPAAIPDFTGRESAVETVVTRLTARRGGASAAGPGAAVSWDAAVPVCVVFGPGGAGKSTLAVYVAHRLAAQFPDGCLYAELRSGDRAVSPSVVLERFLRALGVVGMSLPKTLEERAELFRNMLSGRRILTVLDDAMSVQQVSALLPGTADCAVLVTSRRRLTGLPSTGQLELDTLTEEGAVELLSRFIGPERVTDPESVAELARLCGRLPLALRICAARLAARPHWTVAALVHRLTDESHRLDELSHGEMTVRSSTSLTYDSLPDDARLLFRRLALLDVPDFPFWVGSPLLDVDALRAQEALEILAEAYLIRATLGPSGQVRYSFHDITRPFAQEQLVEENAQERGAALERWLGALLSLAGEAHRREYAGDFLKQRGEASRWPLPERLVERLMSDPLEWFEQERSTIVAAVRHAAVAGLVDHSWDLALSSVTLFEARCYFDDWRETHEVALEAVCQAGNTRGEAAMRYSLGSLHMFEQSAEPGRRQLDRACELYRELGDESGVAMSLRNLAYVDRLTGDLRSAQDRWETALAVFRESGDRVAEAHVLNSLAQTRLDAGEPEAALALLSRADAICVAVGNRRVAAQVRNRLGGLHLAMGRLPEAAEAYAFVLSSARAARDRVGECYALLGLASVEVSRGCTGKARAQLVEARELATVSGARMAESRIALALSSASLPDDVQAARAYAERALADFEAIGAPLRRAEALVARGRARSAAGESAPARADWLAARDILVELEVGTGGLRLSDEIGLLLGDRPGPSPALGNAVAGPTGH